MTPPPIVFSGDDARSTNRSPARRTTGSSNDNRAAKRAPSVTTRATTRAPTSLVPTWNRIFVRGRSDAATPGNTLTSVFKAKGVQVYGCTDAKWTLIEPAASLTGITLNPVRVVSALHFRGPSWESPDDGSLVEGTAPVPAPSDTPNSIQQLLITAKTTRGPGVFGDVTFIQRLSTVGGVAPATACTAGATTAVPYQAVYRFFKKG